MKTGYASRQDDMENYTPGMFLFALFPLAYWAYWAYCQATPHPIINGASYPTAVFFLEPAKWFAVGGLICVFLNGNLIWGRLAAQFGIMTYVGAYLYYRYIILGCAKIYPYLPHLAKALASNTFGWMMLRLFIALILSVIVASVVIELIAWAGGWQNPALKSLNAGGNRGQVATSTTMQGNAPQAKPPRVPAQNFIIPGVDVYVNLNPNPAALDKVVGLEKAKQMAVSAIKMAMDDRVYKEYGLTPPGGLLLYGPPGTGKTSFARACAEALGCTFYVVNASSLLGSLVGQSEQAVRNLFAHARAHRPAIIFWDEIDAVGQRRDGMNLNRPSDLILNILLAEMDGFNAKGEKGVLVIGATNRIDILDEALLRPGRFDFKVEVGLPGFEDRVKLLQFFLKGRKTEGITTERLKEIAGQTDGWSPADLKALVDEAAWRALERNEPITADAFKVALEQHNY
jgi:hypothetical protein